MTYATPSSLILTPSANNSRTFCQWLIAPDIYFFVYFVFTGLFTRNRIIMLELDSNSAKEIAVEFDGIYWHSEEDKTKNYHLNKTELCEAKGI